MFPVIVVGAGPVGLYTAHALEKAGIDYVLLERQPSVLNFSGQLIFTWPQTVRLLDQLGLYEDARKVAMPIHQKKRVYGIDGRVTSLNRFWDHMHTNHGYPFLPMLRSDLIEILYKNLEGRDTKIKTSSEVVDIELDDEAAHVRLSDGSTIDGSIVIGADGVHSTTRKLMHKLARTVPRPMASSFYGLFGRAYPPPDLPLEPEVFFESRGAGAVIQCLGNGERLQFVTLKPLPGAPSAGRARYSAEDVESYASSIADVAVCPGVRFGDVWAHVDRTTVRMLNQEEGFMDRWHHGGRVVLVGDAVHKSTSVNGLGMTCGLHSAAALSNLLQGLLRDNQTPSAEDFGEVFARYQRDREREVKPVWDAGYAMIREVTRTSWASWFWDRFVLPWLDTEQLARGLIPSAFLIRYGQVLSYLPFSGEQGRVPWVHRADPLL